ncbi:hydrogenase 4 subunit H [Brenneria goodwinii]|uniref:Formate hydrogenlyase complex 3 iron-sulfur protein Formate hydrogenlyase subunit 6 Ni,Fe-hydrogenase III medium subunit n=1 Tax=Brenneria goodwinii TaxID=1109412 RepID=A0A0G4K315_9GAMM|nr:hydrogenase 4 subunit H [Brenneria goodwinii]ATA24538.1 formate hydrogenlyase complex iron-sulfur subunit [Brenneria goodwinii]MCG8157675.1 hydrogenase 4 subunit H [Brenneria goodwinii]MCG8161084.1 hydrogenase 4 subunit H [Brenneria goodwinii]MCG8165498.1 hydrogenase 4 subunit H [Brenneria goodwinii]MCG8169981.1 hydrogenase 4 subunit H [Brenneria goodwinii]
MLKLFKTILKAGNSTVKYPFKPLEVSAGFRGKPQYDAKQCIACAACTTACPANALTMETDVVNGTRTWQLFLGRCIFCGRCEEVCPTRAIVLSQEFEMAVANKADLYQRATFNLLNCRVCHRPFAPQKEVEYAMALMAQSGLSEEAVAARRHHFETCPECKRKQNMDNKDNVMLSRYVFPPAGTASATVKGSKS